MSKKNKYESDIHIVHSALDVEWLEQPKLFMRYSGLLADAEVDVELVKEKLGIIKAELDRDIRKNPGKFKISDDVKITEPVVSNTILINKKYKKVAHELIDATHEVKMLKGAVRAFEQRKEALENMVKLHGQQYFAGPKVPRNLADEVELRQKKANSNVKIKRTKNKK